MVEEVDTSVLEECGTGKFVGPQMERTANAQKAVDEFLQADMAVGKVDWKSICDDFDLAKRAIAYRIGYTKNMSEGETRERAQHLGMRSNRRNGEIFLVRVDKLEGK